MQSKEDMTVLSELLAGAVEERVVALVQGLKDELADIVREQVDQALTEHGVMEPLMSIKDVAKTLHVSPRTVEDLLIMNRVLNPIWADITWPGTVRPLAERKAEPPKRALGLLLCGASLASLNHRVAPFHRAGLVLLSVA